MIPSTTRLTAWRKPTTAAARITITHDERGNRITIRSANAVLADTQNVTRFTYDKLNRLTAERDPLGYGMDYGYNVLGERTSQTTALGTQTVGSPTNFLYDALGRLETIDYPQGEGEANIDTHFSYGPTNLRMSMTDGVGATTWTYTALGLVKTVEDPSQKVVEYRYDGLGNRARLIYPDLKTVMYTYDKLNRLETVTDWNNQITSYTYLSTQTGFTRQVHRPNGVVSTDTLDPVGRLVDRVHANESTTLASYHYEYEPAGNRWQATERMLGYPNFLPVILNPESGGEKSIDGMEKAYPAPSEGEPLPLEKGAPEEDAYPAPETTKQSSSLLDALVDFFTWLLSPRDTVQAAAPAQAVPLPLEGNTPLGSYFLTGPVETTYLYDNLHRLTEATDNIGNTYAYAYDANGNRVSEQAPGGSPVISVYDQANRLTNVGGAPYAWDANGSLTNDGTRQYIYDQANRLKEVKDLSGNTLSTYTYSGLGDRLTENNTQFVLDLNAGLTQVLQDGTYTYLYGSERIMQQSQASTDYFLGDALGSVRQLVDTDGSVSLTKSYEPYGELASSLGHSAMTMYGYTREWESQGLIYLRARIYSPEMGRFLTRDSWQGDYNMPMSYNAWLYVYANPVRFSDPSGFSYCDSTYANPNECNAPNIHSYNEKVEPESLSWVSNQFGDNVTQYLAPIYDRNGQIVYRTNAAQFLIDGHEMSCEYIQVPGPDGKLKWTCPDGGVYNQNLCGQVTVSAIAYLFDANTTARKIVEQMGVDKKQTTGYGALQNFLNQYYKKYLYAKTQTLLSLGMDSSQLPNYLTFRIAAGNLIVSAITIKNGGSNYGGRVNPSGDIGHWVMITGISREWKNSDKFSAWNWVRIFNPFDNETEYYWWGDFGPAWSENTKNQYTMLLVNPYLNFRDN